eukprot:363309-Chlamydomonas_euryale.AAC.14
MSKSLVPLHKSNVHKADPSDATDAEVSGSPTIGPGAMRPDDGVYVWGAMAATAAATLGPSSSADDGLIERTTMVELTTMESTSVEPTTMQPTQAESTTLGSGVPLMEANFVAEGSASPTAARHSGGVDYGLREHDSSTDATMGDATTQSMDAADLGLRDAGPSAAACDIDAAGRHGSAPTHVEDEGTGAAVPGRSGAHHAVATASEQGRGADAASNEDQLHGHHGDSAGEDGVGLGWGDDGENRGINGGENGGGGGGDE